MIDVITISFVSHLIMLSVIIVLVTKNAHMERKIHELRILLARKERDTRQRIELIVKGVLDSRDGG